MELTAHDLLTEAKIKLPSFILDLHDQYGFCKPKPKGSTIEFDVFHKKTTYPNAINEITALLHLHELSSKKLTVKPGPEVVGKYNRQVVFEIPTNELL